MAKDKLKVPSAIPETLYVVADGNDSFLTFKTVEDLKQEIHNAEGVNVAIFTLKEMKTLVTKTELV